MSRLSDEINKDPTAVFEISADLPSGNKMHGTIGPIVNNRVVMHLGFERTASAEDVRWAQGIADKLMDAPPAVVIVTNTPGERRNAESEIRKFMGGGVG